MSEANDLVKQSVRRTLTEDTMEKHMELAEHQARTFVLQPGNCRDDHCAAVDDLIKACSKSLSRIRNADPFLQIRG